MKILTGILGVLAILACLTTIGVIGYALLGGKGAAGNVQYDDVPIAGATMAPVPAFMPASEDGIRLQPVSLNGHTHDYVESIDKKATCYQAGRLKYVCEGCGDVYYVDVLSTGHVPDDEWEVVRAATKESEGLRVRRCIYCDEIVAQENLVYVSPETGEEESPHVHEYIATMERETTCVLSGIRKYTCSCGSFYTEQVSAIGHVATDWTTAEEATATKMGREQRVCTVCGVVLDSRPIPVKEASASPSGSPSGSSGSATSNPTANANPTATASSGASASASSGASPDASPTPHTHSYTSYVIKEANCTEKGIRSMVCSCGSSVAEVIDLDLNKHDYVAITIPPTSLTPGYTIFRCRRCNYSYTI